LLTRHSFHRRKKITKLIHVQWCKRDKMKRLLIAALLIALAGCMSNSDLFSQREPVKVEPPANEQTVPDARPNRAPPSPAAKAAAATDANLSSGELLDCVTESCKINCSPKVKKQFQPKWCARFKEPIE
jgi:hypothetical protein